MSEIETAERHHMGLEDLIVAGYARMYIDREPALKLIEARDNAVRLALLAEIEAIAKRNYARNDDFAYLIRAAVDEVSEKYTKPKEPTSG